MVVYLITNLVNGKYYVGKTIRSAAKRLEEHFRDSLDSTYYIHSAIRKYGAQNFVVDVLSECFSESGMNLLEQLWIKHLKSYNSDIGYNMTLGGEGGFPTPQITAKKLLYWTPERRAEKSASMKIKMLGKNVGKVRSKEWCDALRQRMLANNPMQSAESRKKISIALTGRDHTITASGLPRKKTSLTGKTYEQLFGVDRTVQRKREQSERSSRQRHSEETKKLMSERRKAYWALRRELP